MQQEAVLVEEVTMQVEVVTEEELMAQESEEDVVEYCVHTASTSPTIHTCILTFQGVSLAEL